MMPQLIRFGRRGPSCVNRPASCLWEGGKIHHGVRQQPRGPHPHGEKMAVFHGFERTTASIYMVDTETQRVLSAHRFPRLNKRGPDRAPLAGGAERPLFQHRVSRRDHGLHRAWRHRLESCFLDARVAGDQGASRGGARLCVICDLALKLCVEKAVPPPHGRQRRGDAASAPSPRPSMANSSRAMPPKDQPARYRHRGPFS